MEQQSNQISKVEDEKKMDGGHLTAEQTKDFIKFSEQQLPELPDETSNL